MDKLFPRLFKDRKTEKNNNILREKYLTPGQESYFDKNPIVQKQLDTYAKFIIDGQGEEDDFIELVHKFNESGSLWVYIQKKTNDLVNEYKKSHKDF